MTTTYETVRLLFHSHLVRFRIVFKLTNNYRSLGEGFVDPGCRILTQFIRKYFDKYRTGARITATVGATGPRLGS